jgi:hypothetical protein
MRALVAGWFSWAGYGATAGDLMACDVARRWLEEAGLDHDVAYAPPFQGGVDWREVDAARYTHLVFVCGPFRNIGPAITDFLDKFRHCYRVGLDLTMLQPVGEWSPFDLLLERDSDRAARPDIAMACRQPKPPVAAVCLVHPQREYGGRGRHREAGAALRGLAQARGAAAVAVDTRLDVANAGGLRAPGEVEAVLARADVVLTTRLHGLALALKNGVPAVAVDPVAGGAKVLRQARALGWPAAFEAGALDEAGLARAYDWCLTAEARRKARECAERAHRRIDEEVRRPLLDALADSMNARVG